MKGPWPQPAQDRLEPAAIAYADRFPAWGHRKLALFMREDGLTAPDSTVLRPHESSKLRRPLDVHHKACKTQPILKSTRPEPLP